jgi:predicted nuclease of predicted toxin-antitoxin system
MKYLIDANLPYYFSLWNNPMCIHVRDLDDEWSDEQIWEYAAKNNLTIVTKDSDFSDKIILSEPPPSVIQIRVGNMKLKDFYTFLVQIWEEVCQISEEYKLVNVYKDRIEGVD